MNGYEDFTPLQKVDVDLENIRALLWLLYQSLSLEENVQVYTAAVDAILEYACMANRNLQEFIKAQMKEARHVEV